MYIFMYICDEFMKSKDRKLLNFELGRVSAEEYRRLPDSGIVVVLDNVRSAHNVGSVFRTADAFKIDRIFLCGICPTPPSSEIHKSALGAEESVAWEYAGDTADVIRNLRDDGYTVVSIEQTVNSVKLDMFHPYSPEDEDILKDMDILKDGDMSKNIDISGNMTSKKYALVFGNEVDGVRQDVVDESDFAIEIPQFGMKHSLNVSVSAGVVLWHFTLLRQAALRQAATSEPTDNFGQN